MSASKVPESHFIDAPAGRLHYHDFGEGEATILVHGGGPGAYGLSNYRRNVDALSQGRRVIVIDLPGLGQSDSRPAPGSLFEPMAAAVLDLMNHLGLDKASFVGNSLGGATSLRFTLDHPERTHKLVLMGPAGGLPVTSTFPTEGLMRMLNFYEGEGPSIEKLRRVVELLVYDQGAITEELLAERYRDCTSAKALANPPLRGRGYNPKDDLWRERLNELQHPTLLIWGRDDRVLPLDSAFVLLKCLPQAELHVFPNCGHWVQWEKADRFNELVGRFLDD